MQTPSRWDAAPETKRIVSSPANFCLLPSRKEGPADSARQEDGAGAGEGKNASAVGEEALGLEQEVEEVTRTRKKLLRLQLGIGGPGFVLPKLSAEQLKVPPALLLWQRTPW